MTLDDRRNALGSPPLARGRRRPRHRRRTPVRLTPARAGKTPPPSGAGGRSAAHPRSRGEDASGQGSTSSDSGSPPLARGRRRHDAGLDLFQRLTPARAGKTRTGSPPTRCPAAHPRSRGEDDIEPGVSQLLGGSPPLARGRRGGGERDQERDRLTPARAGKTAAERIGSVSTSAHPRSRGEDSRWRALSATRVGSPPLARGRPKQTEYMFLEGRLTPARAGKTRIVTLIISRKPAHPARAGKTRWPAARSRPAAAHPRSRGEDTRLPAGKLSVYGSPPLARGRPLPDLAL